MTELQWFWFPTPEDDPATYREAACALPVAVADVNIDSGRVEQRRELPSHAPSPRPAAVHTERRLVGRHAYDKRVPAAVEHRRLPERRLPVSSRRPVSVVNQQLALVQPDTELHLRRAGGYQREDALVVGRGVLVEFESYKEGKLLREVVARRHEGRRRKVKVPGARGEAVGVQTVGVVVGDFDAGRQRRPTADGVPQHVDRLQVWKTQTVFKGPFTRAINCSIDRAAQCRPTNWTYRFLKKQQETMRPTGSLRRWNSKYYLADYSVSVHF